MLPPTNPTNLMAERDFYKLSRMTKADVVFLEAYIQTTGEPLRESHRNLVAYFAHIANAIDLIQNIESTSTDEKRYAQTVGIELEERLQGQIEQDALPILEALRQKRGEFVKVDKSAAAFFRFLAHQYFRTKHLREALRDELAHFSPNHDFSQLTNIICHISAENVGASLFRDRNEFDIAFFDDIDEVGFITGDQPVVNLMGTGDGRETTELALYYPLSPCVSCLVVPKEFRQHSVSIPGEIVYKLNDLIAWESSNFWVANSDGVLQQIVLNPPVARPESGQVLDLLLKES